MSDLDPATQPPPRRPPWVYMLGGAALFLLVYGFLFRRGTLDMRLWDSPVRVLVVALLGAGFGWLACRLDSRSR
jgi:hypothetical protein